jgi:hypothetical protein
MEILNAIHASTQDTLLALIVVVQLCLQNSRMLFTTIG